MGEEFTVLRLVVSKYGISLESEDRLHRYLVFATPDGVDKEAALEYFMAAVDRMFVRPLFIPEAKC